MAFRSAPQLSVVLLLICAAAASAQRVTFRARTLSVSEGAGSLAVECVRTAGGARAVVWCETADRSGHAGYDFDKAADSVVFDKDATTQSFAVHILDNYRVDGTRSFAVTMRAAPAGPVLDSMLVEIQDNDGESTRYLTIVPATIDFGDANIGVMATRMVTVTTTAPHEVRFGAPTITRGEEHGFQVAYQPSILILGSNSSTQLAVGFNPRPGTAGSVSAGTITFNTTAGSATVNVSGRSIDTIPPTITFGIFRAHDTVSAGTVATIALVIADNDTIADALVEYVTDNGHGEIAHEKSEVRGLKWPVPENLQSDHCRIRVQARDRLGNTATATSPAFVVRGKR